MTDATKFEFRHGPRVAAHSEASNHKGETTMTKKAKDKVWAIFSYPRGSCVPDGVIETSKGYPHRELQRIAKRMNCNGDECRFRVSKCYL